MVFGQQNKESVLLSLIGNSLKEFEGLRWGCVCVCWWNLNLIEVESQFKLYIQLMNRLINIALHL